MCAASAPAMTSTRQATGGISTATRASATRGAAMRSTTDTPTTSAQVTASIHALAHVSFLVLVSCFFVNTSRLKLSPPSQSHVWREIC